MSYTPRIDSTTPELVVCGNTQCPASCLHHEPHTRRDSCSLRCDSHTCVPVEVPVDSELALLGDNALRYHRMWVRLGEEIRRLRGSKDDYHLALVSRYMDYLEEAEK